MSLLSSDRMHENHDKESSGVNRTMCKSSPLKDTSLRIRRIPYPYQSMLAICSDLDETPDRQVYFEIMRFLNTTEETFMGSGVGLEVANTIYFDMPPNQFAYWNTDDTGREMVRDLIHSGHIDCLHSYGDLATTRGHAGRALDELNRYGCHIEAWVDHGTAPTNFDGDTMKGSGDVPGSSVYHADLTKGFGVKYACRCGLTSIIGQNIPKNFAGLWNSSHPFHSGKTILKEFTKGLLGQYGNKRYKMHAFNNILHRARLRDDQEIYEFMRSNPHWGSVGLNATAVGIKNVLIDKMLQNLVERQGFCILYTHLGKTEGNAKIFTNETRQAFALLSQFMREGKILVTTTRRLLGYCLAIEKLSITTTLTIDDFQINVFYSDNKDDLAGLTIYLPKKNNVKLWINHQTIDDFLENPPDQTGQHSISLPFQKLEFPNRIY